MPLVHVNDLRRAQHRDAFVTQDLQRHRVIGPHGNNHVGVVLDELCGLEVIIPNAAASTFAPGAAVLSGTPGGGRNRAVLSKPPSGGGTAAPLTSDTTVKVQARIPPTGQIALRVKSTSDDNIVIDVAEFFDGALVSVLFEDLVLPGGVNPLSDNSVGRLRTARTIVGLTGVADGSILLSTTNTFPQDPVPPPANPRTAHVHVIDVATGDVHSREFGFSFPNSAVSLEINGWTIQDDAYYYMFHAPAEARTELVTFPPTLTSQTILSTEIYTPGAADRVRHGTLFFADDALNPRGFGLQQWDRLPYAAGFTELHVDSVPIDPGRSRGHQPYGLGLADGKYWVMGRNPDSATTDLQPFFLDEFTDLSDEFSPPFILPAIDVVALQGWKEMGPQLGQMFIQGGFSGHDIDDTHIYGFPLDRTPGSTPGFMRLALDATTWAQATITVMETGDFDADMVLPDRRAP